MIKVFVDPPWHLSRAMFRVADALKAYVPPGMRIVSKRSLADVEVLHVIGLDALQYQCGAFAVIQYCCNSKSLKNKWMPLWKRARLVWSYYDLGKDLPCQVLHTPLGFDPSSFYRKHDEIKDNFILTSGYVSAPEAEAIEEAAHAAHRAGLQTIHIGPMPEGLTKPLPSSWEHRFEIPDAELASLYRRARWVCGLRHVEGFELPCVEGLACGARPVVFDRSDMRQWYEGHAEFVRECHGAELEELLVEVFSSAPSFIQADEEQLIIDKFSWGGIISKFWTALEEQMSYEKQTTLHR